MRILKYSIFIILMFLIPFVIPSAYAYVDPATQTAITHIFGDKAPYIFNVIVYIGYVWVLLRQLIPPELMAKLPKPLITILEFCAGNRGHCRLREDKDPQEIKKCKTKKE